MFGWFKKKIIKERHKLIFQNNSAAQRNKIYFERIGDIETSVRLESYEEENARIAKLFYEGHDLTTDDLQMLLDINREMRRLFEEAEINGSEARVRRMMGQPVKLANFDETFKPILGWDNS